MHIGSPAYFICSLYPHILYVLGTSVCFHTISSVMFSLPNTHSSTPEAYKDHVDTTQCYWEKYVWEKNFMKLRPNCSQQYAWCKRETVNQHENIIKHHPNSEVYDLDVLCCFWTWAGFHSGMGWRVGGGQGGCLQHEAQ